MRSASMLSQLSHFDFVFVGLDQHFDQIVIDVGSPGPGHSGVARSWIPIVTLRLLRIVLLRLSELILLGRVIRHP